MCGIVGYFGKRTNIKNMLTLLKNLEYRGYDSSGIAYKKNGKILCYKKVGKIDNLIESVTSAKSGCIICHTRWATHGKVSELNAHPVLSNKKSVAVVHNGIIENYQELKEQIGTHLFKTSTDTEVIANLVENLSGTTLQKIIKAQEVLKGTYAALVMDTKSKYLYAMKNQSPLYIAYTGKGYTLASDISCLNAPLYYNLPDGVVVKISKKQLWFYINGKQIELSTVQNTHTFVASDKQGYSSFMKKEISETPWVINNILTRYKNNPKLLPQDIFTGVNNVVLCGCGTAYHACLLGASWINKLGISVVATIASELRYNPPIIDENSLCIFVSQSGETADTLAAATLAKQKGAKVVAITNVEYSTLASLADYTLPLCAGSEVAVASTKAYSAMLVVLYMLSHITTDFLKLEEDLSKLCSMLIVKDINQEIIDKVCSSKRVFFIGRGDDGVTAQEGALKLKEIAYLDACGYYAGELKHGTIALIEPGVVVIAIITNPKLKAKTLNAVEEVVSRGATPVIVTDDPTITGYNTILVPNIANVELKSIVSMYPLQMLALQVCESLGFDPDKPRNLAKSVTVE